MIAGFKIALGVMALTLPGQRAWAEANRAAALTEGLTQYYRPVGIGAASGARSQIKLFTVRKPGILGIASSDAASTLEACPSIFRSGRLYRSPGIFCSESANQSQKTLAVAERVYVTSIVVNAAFDKVNFYLAACGECKPDTRQAVLRSLVVFEFRKGYLAKAGVNDVVHTIGLLFTADDVAADSPAPAPPEPAAGDPATPSDPAPAPTPPSAAAPIVKKGQSPADVEKVLGKPLAIFDLGTKLVYVYPSMKVFYVGGKLADVQ